MTNFEEKMSNLNLKKIFVKKSIFKKNQIILAYVTPRVSMGSQKKFSQFSLAVWPAIANK